LAIIGYAIAALTLPRRIEPKVAESAWHCRSISARPGDLCSTYWQLCTTAQQFAAAGATMGKIYSANQGSIQIFGRDESGPYSPTSTPMKKIRVVNTFAFELK
jgi:hypothetical protein